MKECKRWRKGAIKLEKRRFFGLSKMATTLVTQKTENKVEVTTDNSRDGVETKKFCSYFFFNLWR